MRVVGLIPAVMALFVSGAAYAQAWEEYVNRGDFFAVNFPGEPAVQTVTYKTAKGTSLPAHVYSAQDRRGSYKLTVVDYTSALSEFSDAMDEAAADFRKRGAVKYAEVNQLDNHRSWRISVETGDKLQLGEILTAMNNRLYISESETPRNAPPPALFQVSLQILDKDGVRIRYREGTPKSPDEILPVSPQAYGAEATRLLGLMSGKWKSPTGSCEAAFFTTGERTQTKRGEDAMTATLVNGSTKVVGQAILSGAREGQFIDPATDKAILLFDPQTGKLPLSFIGAPAIGWPDVTLEPCRG
jgi:hypothetical protein